MGQHPLNFVVSGSNLLYDFGSYTGVTTLTGSGLGNSITTVTLMAIYGLTASNPFGWAITSAP